jgi:UDP-N-acetylglucosamine 2-epimerase (non-hydrolysing)
MYVKLKKNRNVQVLPPLGYLDFLILMRKAELVITDSGGIQEEATAPLIRKPVLVVRLSTERPEAVESGFAEVVGTGKNKALKAIEKTIEKRKDLPTKSPFGDGRAAERIVDIVREEIS